MQRKSPMNSQKNLNLELVEEALCWIGTVEDKAKGDNKGDDVERFQKAVDGKSQSESWCMAFVQFLIKLIEDKYQIRCMVYKSEHCLTVYRETKHKLVKNPRPGDIVIWKVGDNGNGHTGILKELLPNGRMITIEGNTSDSNAGDQREGDGVFEKNRSQLGTKEFKVMGFIRPF